MSMTREERMVLVELHRRTKEIAARPSPPKWQRWECEELADLRRYGPAYSAGEWWGDESGFLPERVRVRMLRAVYALHAAGLLKVVKTGGRLTNIRLTDEGAQAAAGLTGDEVATARPRRAKPAPAEPIIGDDGEDLSPEDPAAEGGDDPADDADPAPEVTG